MKRSSAHLLRIMLFLGASALASAQGVEPETYHTTPYGALNPSSEPLGRYSGLTGYVDAGGREYALLGGYDGTYIIDVTEQPIRLVSKIDGPRSGWREIKTFEHYAYVVNETGRGLQIIDLSRLPDEATHVRFDSSTFYTGHTVSQEGRYLYVHGSDVGAGANGGTLIYDLLDDPTDPKLVGKFTEHYVHDATIRNDTLYAAAIMDNGLSIVYLGADRTDPQLVAQINYNGAGTHNSDLTEDGRYVMTTDEINGSRTLKVWDVGNVHDITKVADYSPQPGSIIHNVHTLGRLAYVSWYSGGTRIIDMSVPSQPAEVGYFDAFPGTQFDFVGNWEVYPYLPSGKILASYMETGLQVFTFDGATRGSVRGVVRDAVTREPVPSVVIDMPSLGGKRITDAMGKFSYAAATDTIPFSAYALNYKIKTGEFSFTPGDGTEQDIFLEPLAMADRTISVVDNETGLPISSYSYQIVDRERGGGRKLENPSVFRLPADSSYRIYVGAWGYVPALVPIGMGTGSHEIRLRKGYADNAEVDQGWSFSAPGDVRYGGLWNRGIPREIIYEIFDTPYLICPEGDHTDDPGTIAFILGNVTPGGDLALSPAAGVTTLTSPAMDLSGYTDPYINCAIWYSNNAFETPDDRLVLKVSNDNGATWEVISTLGTATEAWTEHHLRLKDVITPGNQVRFRVVAYDTAYYSIVMAGMDDFSVTEGNPSSVERPAGAGARAEMMPNPASGDARLLLVLPQAQRNARIELFDLLGRRVALLHEGALPAGASSHTIAGSSLPPGRYVWRMRQDDGTVLSGMAAFIR